MFIGLKPKQYAFSVGNKEKKTNKGTKKNVIEDVITFNNYYTVLENSSMMRHTMNNFVSDHHQVSSCVINKVNLSSYDDKRFIHDNGITSYSYGHYLSRVVDKPLHFSVSGWCPIENFQLNSTWDFLN